MSSLTKDKVYYTLLMDFPALFNPELPRPLSFAIHKQLTEYYEGELKSDQINIFLGLWTNRTNYYRAILKYGYRFDLLGSKIAITDRHKTYALNTLQRQSAPP